MDDYVVNVHTVVVLAWDGVVPHELSVPLQVFGRARHPGGGPAYRVRIAAVTDRVGAGPLRVRATDGPDALSGAGTVVVPGTAGPDPPPEPLVRALRAARSRGTRVVAVGAGVDVLAGSGLLDDGVLTGPAGLDLCLHVVEQDLGGEAAAGTARALELSVSGAAVADAVPGADPPADGGSLEPLLTWLHENIDRDLTLDDIAARAGVSKRTLGRRFHDELGTSPARWLQQTRLRLAQQLLETTALPVDRIAREVGFGSPTTLREGFRTVVGQSPHAYRRAAREGGPAGPAPDPPPRPAPVPPVRSGRAIDVGDLRAAVPDLVGAITAAAASAVDDDAPPPVRAIITEHLEAVVPRIVPVVLDSLEHGRPLSEAELEVFRSGGADIAQRGVPLLQSLKGVGPALAVFTRLVLHGTAAVPVPSRALLLARAAQVAHRMAMEITVGYLQARSVTGTPASGADDGPRDAEALDDVDRMMLDLVVQGRSNDHIARATSYSPQTVRWRLSRLMRRWAVPNRAALAVAAVRRGALGPATGTDPDRPAGGSSD